MKRRTFLKHGIGLGGAALAAGALSVPLFRSGGNAWADGSVRRPLPIPPLAEFQTDRAIELTMQAGHAEILPGLKSSTWGFNGPHLGPTVRMRKGQDVPLIYRNNLAEPIAVHGHGLHVSGDLDGGPQQEIAPGDTWSPVLPIRQQACTSWYHPHTHGRTGPQVYNGLAGLLIIDDDNSDDLALPSTYGVDDIPVIVQDRTFNARGALVYSIEDIDEEDGFMGDTVIVNGIADPVVEIPAGLIRLRLLNGSNARFYRFHFNDGRTFYKIATDGGFLERPVSLTELIMSPGERNEIIVDFSDGRAAMLVSGPPQSAREGRDRDEGRNRDGRRDRDDRRDGEGRRGGQAVRGFFAGGMNDSLEVMELRVNPALPAFRSQVPGQLNLIERPPVGPSQPDRTFVLNMRMNQGKRGAPRGSVGHAAGAHGAMQMSMAINGQMMDTNIINERVRKGVWERWRVENDDGHHPFHVHGCSFLVLSQDDVPVREEDAGWKDTVWVNNSAEFMVRFDYEAPDQYPYMYHCHILEHEDMGMMGQFTVA